MSAFRYIGLVALGACATPHTTPAPQPVAASQKEIRWFRASAEYRGLAMQVYRSAAEHLDSLTRGLAPGSWAVILDADETVLDNSLNERRMADRGVAFNERDWAMWVRERAAPAVPGAAAFTHTVHARGGKVAIVTNRADSLCGPTRDNLRSAGIEADVVLCQPGSQSDKNPRFRQVQEGVGTGLGALRVVEWLGDNIQDFPNLTQAIRSTPAAYADFGVRFFLLPNPMYGSWEKNPEP